jgi:hypothetical protein
MRCVNCGYPLLHKNLPSPCSHPNAPHVNDVQKGQRVVVEPSKEVVEAPVVEEKPKAPPVKPAEKPDEKAKTAGTEK